MSDYDFVMIQGYHLDTYTGNPNMYKKMGPEERREEYRADRIEFMEKYRMKKEKRRRGEYDDEESW